MSDFSEVLLFYILNIFPDLVSTVKLKQLQWYNNVDAHDLSCLLNLLKSNTYNNKNNNGDLLISFVVLIYIFKKFNLFCKEKQLYLSNLQWEITEPKLNIIH